MGGGSAPCYPAAFNGLSVTAARCAKCACVQSKAFALDAIDYDKRPVAIVSAARFLAQSAFASSFATHCVFGSPASVMRCAAWSRNRSGASLRTLPPACVKPHGLPAAPTDKALPVRTTGPIQRCCARLRGSCGSFTVLSGLVRLSNTAGVCC